VIGRLSPPLSLRGEETFNLCAPIEQGQCQMPIATFLFEKMRDLRI
jgi:hypothetical protein